MAIHDQVGIVLVKDEGANYGVDAAPAAANAIKLLARPTFDLNLQSTERGKLTGGASTGEPIIGAAYWDIVLEFELKGSGTAGTAPEIDPLLESAGLLGANSPGASETYTPSITSDKSCTIWWYADGLIYKATGCRGNLTIAGEAGGNIKCTWTGKGLYAVPIAGALVSSPVYQATEGRPLVGATFTYGSYSAVLRAFSIDCGIGVTALPAISSANGISSVELDRFNVTGSMTIGHVLVAARAVENLAVAGASVAFSLALGSAGNIVTITSAALRKTAVKKASNGGQLDLQIDFKMSENASLNNDITIAFT
jgi:hypothetical protein